MDENHYSYGHNVCWHEAGVAAANATWEGMRHSVFIKSNTENQNISCETTNCDLQYVFTEMDKNGKS